MEVEGAEAFGFDVEGAVEAGAVVFPRDRGREFDGALLAEQADDGGVEVVGDIGRRGGEAVGEAEDVPFVLGEER